MSTHPRLHLADTPGLSLRDRICQTVSAAIADGTFGPGQPLPSCRALARQLGLSRNTVFAAYGKLTDLGLLVAKDRSGFTVSAGIPPTPDGAGASAVPELAVAHLLAGASARPSALRKIEHPQDWSRFAYPFLYSQIDPAMFPLQAWRECMRLALNAGRLPAWSGDAGGEDSPQLLDQLRGRLLSHRGLSLTRDEILITSGAQNALFILGLLFRDAPGAIAVEDPGYPEARNAFALSGNALAAAPVDAQGLVPDLLPARCKAVYCTPSHQFPTGVTLPLDRRRKMLDIAARRGMAIVEDDYEAEMNYRRDRIPPIRSLDPRGRVIYVGSLSKTLSPGLRLGFMVAHPEIIAEARAIRRAMLRHPPAMMQDAMAHFLALGHYDAHLRRLHRRFRARWETMRDALATHLPGYAAPSTQGGTCFWLEGPPDLDMTALVPRLKSRGVLFDSGAVFFADPARARGRFRLGFAPMPLKSIEPGIRIIAEEIRAAGKG